MKLSKVVFMFFILLLLIACPSKDKKTSEDVSAIDEDATKEQAVKSSEATLDTFQLLAEGNLNDCAKRGLEGKIFFLVSKFCSHCKVAEPVIDELIKKYKLKKFYSRFDLAEELQEKKLDEYKIKAQYTPTLIINCKVYIGNKPKPEFEALFKEFKERL